MWVEKYRPKSLDEMVNQTEITSRMKNFVKNRNFTNLLLVGPPGVGKFSSILALAQSLYGERYQNFLKEINFSDRPVSRPTKIEKLKTPELMRRRSSEREKARELMHELFRPPGSVLIKLNNMYEIDAFINEVKNFAFTPVVANSTEFKIIIMNNAENLTKETQHAFRRPMEEFTATCRFCFICTNLDKIIEPIRSRCNIFNFAPLREEDFKGLLSKIALKENVTFVDEALDVIYQASKGNMRKAINLLQAGSAISPNRIVDDEVIYKILKEFAPNKIREMIKLGMMGNFIDAREILRSLLIDDSLSAENILEDTYNELMSMPNISDEWKIKITDIVGQVDYNLTQGDRKEIQLSVLLSKLALIEKK